MSVKVSEITMPSSPILIMPGDGSDRRRMVNCPINSATLQQMMLTARSRRATFSG
ncbi:hypothetical protein IHQ71_13665 [Rhizobium sp. TH2]|nr:hypothetical protein [Rhizobium sp. TH2]UVC11529.1 hypothetical protein IHQ71_13665 [Rhizobium sp. TH2]